ncbi:MAG: hypothetical protein ACK6D7_03565, partial [Acidobacteriota bacterium]
RAAGPCQDRPVGRLAVASGTTPLVESDAGALQGGQAHQFALAAGGVVGGCGGGGGGRRWCWG